MFTESLVYALFALCVVYPPTEVIAAGFTIAQLFEGCLRSENVDFVYHHVKRSALTLFLHSLLPLGYIGCLLWNNFSPNETFVGFILSTTSLTLPLIALYLICGWYQDAWSNHPIIKSIICFGDNGNLNTIVEDINNDFKDVRKVCLQLNGISKFIISDKWIIKTSLYNVHFAKQDEATLVIKGVDTVDFSLTEQSSLQQKAQFVNLEVRSDNGKFETFKVRLNALDLKELQEKLRRPIVNVPNIPLQTSITDQFVEIFKEYVEGNPRYIVNQESSLCIGCMQATSNVKLKRNCQEGVDARLNECGTCHCRPLWCCECMARWFASRQDQERRDIWLSSKCTCPVCRSLFCMLDVCLIQTEGLQL